MPDWKKSVVSRNATVGDAIKTIDEGGFEICLVVDDEDGLLGTITDGDVRRGLLSGVGFDNLASGIMSGRPVVASPKFDSTALLEKMNAMLLRQIPLLNDEGRVVGLVHLRDLAPPLTVRNNLVVLMAGGLGSRLHPLTEDTPKPLLPVGNKPLLETILETFVQQNFHNFYISVKYKAEMIKQYFGDGGAWGAGIQYLEEDSQLGTAGALQLIQERPQSPIIVMNGDVLTRVNFQHLIAFHEEHNARATMCVREYDFQVPFGVVGVEGQTITHIDEKPIHRFFVNAGVYVLDPEMIDLVPEDRRFDMPALFEAIIAGGHQTAAFPIHEYWMDVGHIDDLQQAKTEYNTIFPS